MQVRAETSSGGTRGLDWVMAVTIADREAWSSDCGVEGRVRGRKEVEISG